LTRIPAIALARRPSEFHRCHHEHVNKETAASVLFPWLSLYSPETSKPCFVTLGKRFEIFSKEFQWWGGQTLTAATSHKTMPHNTFAQQARRSRFEKFQFYRLGMALAFQEKRSPSETYAA
jgi:hypothetical protein